MQIALYGFGTVGQGFYQLKDESWHVPRIAVRHTGKPRSLPAARFTNDLAAPLAEAPDVVVEAISDTAAALELARQALAAHIPYVSASKKLLAAHLPELVALSRQHQVPLRYEAACGGAIPLVDTLDRYFAAEVVTRLRGILNGTTNYILTQMLEAGLPYESALKQAQALGFAEADPTLDVSGQDARNKLVILAVHAFGQYVHPDRVPCLGITTVGLPELAFARRFGLRPRLVATAERGERGDVALAVLPGFVLPEDPLFDIRLERNALQVDTPHAGSQLLAGPGAGSYPTGAAMRFDVAALQPYRYPKGLAVAPEEEGSADAGNTAPLALYTRGSVPAGLWDGAPIAGPAGAVLGWTTAGRLAAHADVLGAAGTAVLTLPPTLLHRLADDRHLRVTRLAPVV